MGFFSRMINLGKGRLRVARQPSPPPLSPEELSRVRPDRVSQPAARSAEPSTPELKALRAQFDAGQLTEREYLSRRAALLRGDVGQRTL